MTVKEVQVVIDPTVFISTHQKESPPKENIGFVDLVIGCVSIHCATLYTQHIKKWSHITSSSPANHVFLDQDVQIKNVVGYIPHTLPDADFPLPVMTKSVFYYTIQYLLFVRL